MPSTWTTRAPAFLIRCILALVTVSPTSWQAATSRRLTSSAGSRPARVKGHLFSIQPTHAVHGPRQCERTQAEVEGTTMSALRRTGFYELKSSCPNAPASIDIQAGTWAGTRPLRHHPEYWVHHRASRSCASDRRSGRNLSDRPESETWNGVCGPNHGGVAG